MSTNSKGNLPDFLVIGAMKAGTTSLHSYLGKHPDIFTSEIKEIDFFNNEDKLAKGVDWYKQHFISDKRKKGESSQGYTRAHLFKDVPEQIHAVIPNVKLIYILRDPIERIISHYYETVSGGYNLYENIASYMIANPDNNFIKTSTYYWQLEKYLPYFKPEQFLIITSEELKRAKINTLNKIFSFLGVAELRDASFFNFDRNMRSEKKMYRPIIKKFSRGKLGSIIPVSVKRMMKHSWLAQKFAREEIKINPFSESDKSKFREVLFSDVEQLRKFAGKNFDEWSF